MIIWVVISCFDLRDRTRVKVKCFEKEIDARRESCSINEKYGAGIAKVDRIFMKIEGDKNA